MDFPGSANNASNAFNTTATKLGKNQTASLDESIGEEGSQTRGDTLQSSDLSPEDAAIMKNAKARLAVWLQSLSETDRKIIALRKAGKDFREIGEAVGKSHEFVRQRLAKLKAEASKAMEVSGEFQGMVGEQKKAQQMRDLRLVFHNLSRTTVGFPVTNKVSPVPPRNLLSIL